MEPTVIRGIDRRGAHPYEAILNGPGDPVVITPPLDAQLPPTGTPVISGPAGIVRRFNPVDPVTVYIWLRGDTDVLDVEGPDLLPDEPGDLILGDPPADT